MVLSDGLLLVECGREDDFGFAVPASEISVRTKAKWRRQHKSRKLVSHNFYLKLTRWKDAKRNKLSIT